MTREPLRAGSPHGQEVSRTSSWPAAISSSIMGPPVGTLPPDTHSASDVSLFPTQPCQGHCQQKLRKHGLYHTPTPEVPPELVSGRSWGSSGSQAAGNSSKFHLSLSSLCCMEDIPDNEKMSWAPIFHSHVSVTSQLMARLWHGSQVQSYSPDGIGTWSRV